MNPVDVFAFLPHLGGEKSKKLFFKFNYDVCGRKKDQQLFQKNTAKGFAASYNVANHCFDMIWNIVFIPKLWFSTDCFCFHCIKSNLRNDD